MPGGAASDLQPLFERIVRALKAGSAAQAEADARLILSQFPHEPNAIFLLAKARQLAGDSAQALELLDGLIARGRPWLSVYQEKALIQRASGDLAGAVDSLRQVVRLDPRRAAAFGLMAEMLARLGDQAAADEATRQYLSAAARPERLVRAAALVTEGRLAEAETICRDFLRHSPNDLDALRLLAEIATRLSVYDDAERLFARCLELSPKFSQARAGHAHVLMKQGRFTESMAEIDQLLAEEPDNAAYLILLASVLVRVGRHAEAIDTYRRVCAGPNHTALDLTSLGHVLKTVGRTEEAIGAYRRAIARNPFFGDAWWSLANLKTFQFGDADIESMRQVAESGRCGPHELPAVLFALGKGYEDRGQWAEAFRFYQRGNDLRRAEVRYSAEDNTQQTTQLIECCDAGLFARQSGHGSPDPAPIFIVGLPRSGSTLIEQILASHPAIEGTAELPDIIDMARQLSGRHRPQDPSRYPAILHELEPARLRELGEEYLQRTRVQRQGAPFFIDKMPNNFPHIALIHLILPRAKIIDARRHPMACCFSAYKQLFATGQNFSYDLTDLGRYYADYVRLMAHWDAVLPGRVLRVFYEEAVGDLESTVRRLLDYCGLPFEERCLRFHETERSVRTASSEQVRRPLYREGVDHWRNFEPYLKPLEAALGSALTEYPYR